MQSAGHKRAPYVRSRAGDAGLCASAAKLLHKGLKGFRSRSVDQRHIGKVEHECTGIDADSVQHRIDCRSGAEENAPLIL